MINSLYDNFKHWSGVGSVFLYSDPHFNDADCLLMNPNWPSPEEQIKRINQKVHKNDTLIILGDIGDENYIKQLKVENRILIMGNHDKGASNYKKIYGEIETPYGKRIIHNKLFDEVYEGALTIGPDIILSHEPINLPFGLNISGHNHAGPHITKTAHSIIINVAANVIGYEPLRLDKLLDGLEYDGIHRLAIDKAIARKD